MTSRLGGGGESKSFFYSIMRTPTQSYARLFHQCVLYKFGSIFLLLIGQDSIGALAGIANSMLAYLIVDQSYAV